MIVQLAGRLQAGTERLLYDDPPETIWRLGLVQTALQQTLRDDLVHHRRGSQVIDDLIRQVMFLLQELDALTQFVVFIGVRGIEGEVIDILQEVIDQALVVSLSLLCLQDMRMLLRTELLITISGTGSKPRTYNSNKEGSNLRLVRSPDAPNITNN